MSTQQGERFEILKRISQRYRVGALGFILYRYGPKAQTTVSDRELAIELLKSGAPIPSLLIQVQDLINLIKEGEV